MIVEGCYFPYNWTAFSSLSMHFLLATRIIYGENTNCNDSDPNMEIYLKHNRDGVAWEITNRLLESLYRYNNGKTQCFSINTMPVATLPTVYTILTYGSGNAFSSLNGNNAKGAIASTNTAFKEALYDEILCQ